MLLWRISGHGSLEGLGGELGSARWHTKSIGKRIVYLAEHPALALVETLVNIRGIPSRTPDNYQLLKVAVASSVVQEVVSMSALPSTWVSDVAVTQQLGDSWLDRESSALLKVPSVPSPESWNYLLNPRHDQAHQIAIEWHRRIAYDPRNLAFERDSQHPA